MSKANTVTGSMGINENLQKDKIEEKDVKEYIDEYNSIKEKDYKNIAFMGPYGAGKSYIINKIKEQDPDKFININMLEFSEDTSNDKRKGKDQNQPDLDKYDKEEKIRKVERSIIQQLIYQEKQKDIPFSKIKKEFPNKGHVIFNISLMIVFIILISCFSVFECFKYIVNFNNSYASWISLICFSTIILLASYLLFLLFYYCYINFRVSKIKYEKNNYSIECEKYESVYNQFLDEIIYFLKNTTYTTIVFEDIDRYNDLLFFSHLRELNALLNNSKYLNKKITFIYAIRDDLFRNQDKNKFFDFIIPVIPIMDYTNSLSYLTHHFKLHTIKKETLQFLSYYISDLRTLKNIFHEFDFYNKLASNNIYTNDNLLAILFLKNLYPAEFAKLQYRESVIDIILKKKTDISEDLIKKEETEYKILTTVLKDKNYVLDPKWTLLGILKEFIEDQKKELDHIYYNVKIGNQEIRVSDTNQLFTLNISWETLKKIKSLVFTYNTQQIIKELPEYIKQQIGILDEIQQSKEITQKKTKQDLMDKIDELEQKINDYTNIKASKLFNEKEANQKLDQILDEYVKRNNIEVHDKFVSFVKMLITSGLIDESYTRYISLTFDNIVSEKDLTFIRNVLAGVRNSFNDNLDNLDFIYHELKNNLYDNQCAFNFDVIKYLAKQNYRNLHKLLQSNIDSLQTLYHKLDPNEDSFEIIAKCICENEKSLGQWVEDEKDDYKKASWIKFILCLENKVFNKLSISNGLIENIKNFDLIKLSKITKHQIKNLVDNMSSKNLEFLNISGVEKNKDLFDEIIKNHYFEINYENLYLLNNSLNYEELTKGYGILDYINSNIEKYLFILVKYEISTVQSLEFFNVILKKVNNTELICNYLKNNVREIENIDTLLPLDNKILIALCKNQGNTVKILNSPNLNKEQKIIILKSIKIDIKDTNVNKYLSIINKYDLFEKELVFTQIYQKIMNNLINQTEKEQFLQKLLPLIDDRDNMMRILKAYDDNYYKTKKEFTIDKSEVNNLIVDKLKEFRLYEITENGNSYQLRRKQEIPMMMN